jgi:integrase
VAGGGQAPRFASNFTAWQSRVACGDGLHGISSGTLALELAREGVALNIIQRQLGHANLGTTSIYLQGIDTEEIIATVHGRRGPMMSATAGLRL